MTAINNLLAATEGELPKQGLPTGLREVLVKAAPVYQRYWWSMHDRANRAWITDVARKVETLAPAVTSRLAHLMQTPWFTKPVRIDVVRRGKVHGAYTSIHPQVHITIASGEVDSQQWAGAEIVFHEASHALIDPIRERIATEARTTGKKATGLWHVVLFFTAGEVVCETLQSRKISYTPYIYATGLFQNAWPQFQNPLE